MTFDDYECSEFTSSDDEEEDEGKGKEKDFEEGDPEEEEVQEGEEGAKSDQDGEEKQGESSGESPADEPDDGVLEQKYEVLNPAELAMSPSEGFLAVKVCILYFINFFFKNIFLTLSPSKTKQN